MTASQPFPVSCGTCPFLRFQQSAVVSKLRSSTTMATGFRNGIGLLNCPKCSPGTVTCPAPNL